ncbi:MAG: AraC family ligand binding domain-containing protein [Selenomonas sp.]|nr:AraC family ligand binding domain-containing protein [Selenomonas sp.]
MYLIFPCPPLPYLIVGGMSTFRVGDRHLRRTLPHTFDLIYVHQGELFMEEKGQNFTVTAGQFLILPPNRLHRGTKACRTETVFHWLHFYTTGTFSCTESPVRDSNVIQKSSQQFEKSPSTYHCHNMARYWKSFSLICWILWSKSHRFALTAKKTASASRITPSRN